MNNNFSDNNNNTLVTESARLVFETADSAADTTGADPAVQPRVSAVLTTFDSQVPLLASEPKHSQGVMTLIPEPMDSILMALSRPYLVNAYSWGAAFANVTISPFSYLASVAYYKNKLEGYSNLKCDAHVRFVVNGSPYHRGRLIAAFLPYYSVRSVGGAGTAVKTSPYSFLAGQSVLIDPQRYTDMVLTIPYCATTPYLPLTEAGSFLTDLGSLRIAEMVGLSQVGQATPSALTLNVYVWFSNAMLRDSTPASFIATSKSSLISEAGQSGPVSKLAVTAASFASFFTKVPIIGPLATATQIGAEAVGRIASIFGFSKPITADSPHRIVRTFLPDHGYSEARDVSAKLTLNPLAELPLSGANVGFEPDDTLSIKYIAGKWGYINRYLWVTTDATKAVLATIPVGPRFLMPISGTHSLATPLLHASLPFTYWRGTLKYRFDFVSCPMLRGRVQIRWVPDAGYSTVALDSDKPNSYKCVVDVSESTQLDVVVGWGSNANVLAVGPPSNTSTPNATTDNGYLVVEVVNPLTSAAATAETIAFFVSVCAGDDYELAVPDFAPYTGYVCVSKSSAIPVEAPVTPPKECHIGGAVSGADNVMLTLFGERHVSLRPLLKRYHPQFLHNDSTAHTTNYRLAHTLPNWSWLKKTGDTVPTDGNEYSTPGGWLSNGFLGQRGSWRIKAVFTYGTSTVVPQVAPCIAMALPNNVVGANAITSSVTAGVGATLISTDFTASSRGAVLALGAIEPLSVEMSTRHPSNFQMPGSGLPNTASITTCIIEAVIPPQVVTNATTQTLVWVCAGEDLAFVSYQAPPLIVGLL